MSDDPDWDPFAPTDGEPADEAQSTPGGSAVPDNPSEESGPIMSQGDNWVSFGFTSDGGYDKIMGTVHGDPQFVADTFAIKDFDGKISTLMKSAIAVDTWFKKAAAKAKPADGGDGSGKG